MARGKMDVATRLERQKKKILKMTEELEHAQEEYKRLQEEKGFARCKLNLELGEYTRDDLDYLHRIYEVVKGRDEYREAIMAYIVALSDEYGWI